MHDVHACMLTVVYKHRHVRTDQLEAFDTKIKHFGADCLLTFVNFCCYLLENMRARSKTTSERHFKRNLFKFPLCGGALRESFMKFNNIADS